MARDIEAHPPPVVADVPTLATGFCNLLPEGLDPGFCLADARQCRRGRLLPPLRERRAKAVKHLLTPADSL